MIFGVILFLLFVFFASGCQDGYCRSRHRICVQRRKKEESTQLAHSGFITALFIKKQNAILRILPVGLPYFLLVQKPLVPICSLLCRGPRNLEEMEGRGDWKSWRFASPQCLARETQLRRVSFTYYWQENQRGPGLRAEGEEETNRATEGIVSHGCHCNRASVQLQSSLALFSPL